MPGVTVTGSLDGVTITVLTSTPLQSILAQQILASATAAAARLVTGSGGVLTAGTTIDISEGGSVLSGNTSVSSANVILDGQNGSYTTGERRCRPSLRPTTRTAPSPTATPAGA